jgi:hypothetical protein
MFLYTRPPRYILPRACLPRLKTFGNHPMKDKGSLKVLDSVATRVWFQVDLTHTDSVWSDRVEHNHSTPGLNIIES